MRIGAGESAKTIEKKIHASQRELMLQLLDHYKIRRDDPHRWLKLSRALALSHVPAFRFEGLLTSTLATLMKRKKGRGAPRRWYQRNYEMLLDVRRLGEVELRKRGAKVTDRAALEAYMTSLGFSKRDIRELAMSLSKRLSEARKAVRKIG